MLDRRAVPHAATSIITYGITGAHFQPRKDGSSEGLLPWRSVTGAQVGTNTLSLVATASPGCSRCVGCRLQGRLAGCCCWRGRSEWGYRVKTDCVWSWLLTVTVEVHAGWLDAAGTTGKPTSATGLIARLRHKRSCQDSR
jgi:hypothetical protein